MQVRRIKLIGARRRPSTGIRLRRGVSCRKWGKRRRFGGRKRLRNGESTHLCVAGLPKRFHRAFPGAVTVAYVARTFLNDRKFRINHDTNR
jgi:hypothetical protein